MNKGEENLAMTPILVTVSNVSKNLKNDNNHNKNSPRKQSH